MHPRERVYELQSTSVIASSAPSLGTERLRALTPRKLSKCAPSPLYTGDERGCGDGGRSCITDVHLEVNGQIAATAQSIEAGRPIQLAGAAPVGSTLVVTGCGGSARIPIDDTPR